MSSDAIVRPIIEGSAGVAGTTAADSSQPYLEVAGVEGSLLQATSSGLTVFSVAPGTIAWRQQGRHWPYARLRQVRLDEYGPLCVVRATIETSGDELPLLLLEPNQIAAARRVLEMVWNLMAIASRDRLAIANQKQKLTT